MANNELTTWPERIYLQSGDECGAPVAYDDHCREVTWCQDQIGRHDVQYVRADLAIAAPAQGGLSDALIDAIHEDQYKNYGPLRDSVDMRQFARSIESRIRGQQRGVSEAAQWLRAAESTPDDGLYVALYRQDKSLVVSMCAYGECEFYSEEKDEDIAEIGWTVFETEDGSTVERRCEVVAYLPTNYNMKSLTNVRAAIQAQAGDGLKGGV